MSDFQNILYLGLRIGFIIVIPAFIIYFRIKKKVKTGFAVGAIITSLLLSLFTYNNKVEPVKDFYNYVNNNDYPKAKIALKIVIQHGPKFVAQIDESKIYNKKMYWQMIREIRSEYASIIDKLYTDVKRDENKDCKNIDKNKLNIQKLEHAQVLISFSESIGGKLDMTKEKIKKNLAEGKKKLADDEKKCKSGT